MAKRVLGAWVLILLCGMVNGRTHETRSKKGRLVQNTYLLQSLPTSGTKITTTSLSSNEGENRYGKAEPVQAAALPIQDFMTCVPYSEQQRSCKGICAQDISVTRCNVDTPDCATRWISSTNATTSTNQIVSCTIVPQHISASTSSSSPKLLPTLRKATASSSQSSSPHLIVPTVATTDPPIRTPFAYVVVKTMTLSMSKTRTKSRHKNHKANYTATGGGARKSRYRAMQIKREVVIGCLIGGIMVLIAVGLGAVLCWGWVRQRRRRRWEKMAGSEEENVEKTSDGG